MILTCSRSPDFITQGKGEPTESDVLKEFSFLSAVENEEDVSMGDEVDGGDQQRSARVAKVFYFFDFMLSINQQITTQKSSIVVGCRLSPELFFENNELFHRSVLTYFYCFDGSHSILNAAIYCLVR